MSARTVLLVDDDADDVELARRAFVRHAPADALVVANDGVEALTYLHGNDADAAAAAELPVVVLLDVKLRRLGGIDVLRHVRAHTRTARLPVVLMTSSVEECDVVEGYAACANGYVRKPDSFDGLVDAMGVILRYWLSLNEACRQPIRRNRR